MCSPGNEVFFLIPTPERRERVLDDQRSDIGGFFLDVQLQLGVCQRELEFFLD